MRVKIYRSSLLTAGVKLFHVLVCYSDLPGEKIVKCSVCPRLYHFGCHYPFLEAEPEPNWRCWSSTC